MMVYRPLHFSTGGDPLVGLYPLELHLHTQFVACMSEMVEEKNSIKNESIVSRFLLRRVEILNLETEDQRRFDGKRIERTRPF